MLLKHFMTRPVLTVQPETEFHMAYELMRQHNIHHLPVMNAGRIAGIVAERDLLLAAAHFGSAEVPVAEIMRQPVVCIAEGATLADAARKLLVKHIGGLPVVNGKRQLVGMITETDIFKVMAGTARGVKKSAGARRPRRRSVAARGQAATRGGDTKA